MSYSTWLSFAFPLMLLNLGLAVLVLLTFNRWEMKKEDAEEEGNDHDESIALGEMHSAKDEAMEGEGGEQGGEKKMTMREWMVLGCFVFVVALWFFREPKFMPGWGQLFKFTTQKNVRSKMCPLKKLFPPSCLF